jgi:hypothetical protein
MTKKMRKKTGRGQIVGAWSSPEYERGLSSLTSGTVPLAAEKEKALRRGLELKLKLKHMGLNHSRSPPKIPSSASKCTKTLYRSR